MQAYYESILAWDDILLDRVQPVPGLSTCAYYGRRGHKEDDVRPITYAALVNAFLAELGAPQRGTAPSAERRIRMRQDATAALRYLVQGHKTGAGACLDGKQWGNQWQSAMWARSVGLAGWLLWPHLDEDLRIGVARLVEFEADRFLRSKPKGREFRDTGAEENAWNAQILSLACNMMPDHPRASQWASAAKVWMYNSLSVAADAECEQLGDDSRPIADWVQTVNVHPDFTLENHGIVHVGYLKTSAAMLLESSVPYLLSGVPVPQAGLHHANDVFGAVCKCMAWDGAAIYFSGNDWKTIHTQCTDVMLYALMSTLTNDPCAARLEDVGLDYLLRIQRAEGGYYNVRRDLEFGGLCATRLVASYLAHACLGEGASPASASDFHRAVCGVTHFKHGRAILHRTPSKFASFSWGAKRMALALPHNGTWVLWPHFASYVGHVDGQDASARRAKQEAVHHSVDAHRFTVTARLSRFGGAVEQCVAWASPPEDVTIYIERIRPQPGFQIRTREAGVIGLEYDLGRNERRIRGAHGLTVARGIGGGSPRTIEIQSDWLNIDDRVGYVVRRFPERANVMRYHDLPKGSGRVPKLQEWISLVGDSNDIESGRPADWACIVTFPNQDADTTARSAVRVQFSVAGATATCRAGQTVVQADFERAETRFITPAD